MPALGPGGRATLVTDEVQTGDPQSHAKGPEIFIGLIGAVGTDLYRIREHLKQELRRANYTPEIIHLSKLMMDLDNLEYLVANDKGPEDDRIDKFMDAGDAIRDSISRGDAVALLGIGKIQDIREENQPTSAGSKREGELADRQRSREIRPLNRRAYIFHSLKHPEEVRTLRRVYGAAFIAISVYSPRNVRKQTLCERIARSRKEYNSEKFASRADELIEKDEKEVGDDFGQNVRDTFPEGDVFVDTTDIETIPAQIARLVNILFGYPYVTPTVDEYGMFHAKAAAMRSADLSRQVGAVITTADGEIIAAGCNEVPKAGGGSVWEGREEDKGKDYRDHTLGYDSTARMKHETIAEIFERLKPDWLASELRDLSPQELATKALYEGASPRLRGTRADSILEFGRMVHAEMSAITDAARRGLSVLDATLYCTTFPCHMCARHIIASGIKQVVYIEPYPKSLAKELYRKSIQVDFDVEADSDAVVFRPFVGISPNRYLDFFSMPKRKDDQGHTLDWSPETAQPRLERIGTYDDAEAGLMDLLAESRPRLGIKRAEQQEEADGEEQLA
jgi:deoxycytidylate deaminase